MLKKLRKTWIYFLNLFPSTCNDCNRATNRSDKINLASVSGCDIGVYYKGKGICKSCCDNRLQNSLDDCVFDALFAECDKRKTERAEKMPDEKSALAQMFEAYQRLQEMGWSDAIYCPKDSSMFSAISAGSTGIHKCNYIGKWPKGSWWIYDGDMWPARPVLWRKRKETDPDVDYGLAIDYKCDCCES